MVGVNSVDKTPVRSSDPWGGCLTAFLFLCAYGLTGFVALLNVHMHASLNGRSPHHQPHSPYHTGSPYPPCVPHHPPLLLIPPLRPTPPPLLRSSRPIW